VNVLSTVTPLLLARGVNTLRENAISPHLVNRDFETNAAQQGDTVTVYVPKPSVANDVVPGAPGSQAADDLAYDPIPILLNNWKESAFTLSDKETKQVVNGAVPSVVDEKIKALANAVDVEVLSHYKEVFGFYTGVTKTSGAWNDPSSKRDILQGRRILNDQLAPVDSRYALWNSGAEAELQELPIWNEADKVGDNGTALREASMGRKLGLTHFMDQNLPMHLAGTADANYVANGAHPAAPTDLTGTVAVSAGAGTFVQGDIISFSNHSQTYVVTADYSGGAGNVSIAPGLQMALAGGETVTLQPSHAVNILAHARAFALVTRPLSTISVPGSIVDSITDPVTGLTLRLEITREHKRNRFSYDILWGSKCVHAPLAVRVPGLYL